MDILHRYFDRGQYAQDMSEIEPALVYEMENAILKHLRKHELSYPALEDMALRFSIERRWPGGTAVGSMLRIALYRMVEAFRIVGPDPYDKQIGAVPRCEWMYRRCTFDSPAGYGEGGYHPLWKA